MKGNLDRKYLLNFDQLCLDGSDILIAELNVITQRQHLLRGESQLAECLRNVSYLS